MGDRRRRGLAFCYIFFIHLLNKCLSNIYVSVTNLGTQIKQQICMFLLKTISYKAAVSYGEYLNAERILKKE